MVLAFNLGFLPFRFLDFIDIVLVAIIMFILYKLVRGSIALNISIGLASIFFIWWLVRALNMRLLSGILGQFIDVGVIALLIVFQQEIRKVLLIIGQNAVKYQHASIWKRMALWNWDMRTHSYLDVSELVVAVEKMAAQQTGALIIISKDTDLRAYVNTGVELRSKVKSEMIISIFQKNSPLHDGALIVGANLLVAASCILPVSQNQNLPREYGLRHRSAIGISEQSDAIAVIVSEESGSISIAKEGKMFSYLTPDQLEDMIKAELGIATEE